MKEFEERGGGGAEEKEEESEGIGEEGRGKRGEERLRRN